MDAAQSFVLISLRDFLGCDVDVGTEIKPRLREHIEAEAVPL